MPEGFEETESEWLSQGLPVPTTPPGADAPAWWHEPPPLPPEGRQLQSFEQVYVPPQVHAEALEQERMKALENLFNQHSLREASEALAVAMRWQGGRLFEKDVNEAVNRGVAQDEAVRSALMRHGNLLFYQPIDQAPSSAFPNLLRAIRSPKPIPGHPQVITVGGESAWFEPITGRLNPIHKQTEKAALTPAQMLSALASFERTASNPQTAMLNPEAAQRAQETADALRANLKGILPDHVPGYIEGTMSNLRTNPPTPLRFPNAAVPLPPSISPVPAMDRKVVRFDSKGNRIQ